MRQQHSNEKKGHVLFLTKFTLNLDLIALIHVIQHFLQILLTDNYILEHSGLSVSIFFFSKSQNFRSVFKTGLK